MLGKDKDGGLKEVAEQTVPDSRSFLPNLGPEGNWEETGTAPGDNREPELPAGGRAGAQVACKALVQTLDNQLCLPWQYPVNTGVCYSHFHLCPLALGRGSREEEDTMLRQNPSQTQLFCQGAQSNKNSKHGHVGVKEETIQVGLKHMMHKMK